jgi:peptide-methionine (S)-S-oxide reductase
MLFMRVSTNNLGSGLGVCAVQSRGATRILCFLGLLSLLACNAARGQAPAYAGKVPTPAATGNQTAVLSGGCFCGVDAVFKHVKGVKNVVSGYSGGSAVTAHYEIVSTGMTGHAKSVKITYDPARISYAELLRVFFSVAHDPTELNRQGPDSGSQYRSVIFYTDDQQKEIAQGYIDQLNNANAFPTKIVTQVVPLVRFYPAEDHHQNFLALHPDYPYIVYNDMPKLDNLKKEFPALYKP